MHPRSNVASDSGRSWASTTATRLAHTRGSEFRTHSRDREPKPFDTVYGAAHALDLPFLFDSFGKSVFSFAWSAANKGGREALSDKMMRSVGAFARSGNPNDTSLGIAWPNWPSQLVFDASDMQTQIRVQ
jgi:para-nitrobenzyl esterase